MKICPKCNTKLRDEARFCDICGVELDKAHQERKKSRAGLWMFLVFLFLLLVGGAYFGFAYYRQVLIHQAEEDMRARELAIQDSLDQVAYDEKCREDSLKQLEASHRVDDLQVLIGAVYNCRKSRPDDVVKYYSLDLKDAYRSWNNEYLVGPQGFLFEKLWEGGCQSNLKIKNYRTEFLEASSPSDGVATFKVKVTFSVHDSSNEDSFVKEVTHVDVFKLIKEVGNWRIDDLVRDGVSAKSGYRNGSSDFGKEECL